MTITTVAGCTMASIDGAALVTLAVALVLLRRVPYALYLIL
jgi:hypothetical protein